jgi:hypothetical protein
MTNNDLNQISGILDQKLKPIQQELQQHGKTLKSLEKDVKTIKRDVSQVRKDQGTMLDLLDKEQMRQRKRIVRLEENTGIQTPQ